MQKKTDVSTPKKGMNKSRHPSEMTEGEYSFALNANIQDGYENTSYILTNEPSNLKCSGFKDGYFVAKHKYDRVRNRTYFFLHNPTTGCSEIGFIPMDFILEPDTIELKECNCKLSVVIEDGLENIIQEGVCVYNTIISDYCEIEGSCTGCLDFDLNKPITDVVIRYSSSGDELYFTQKGKPSRYIKLNYIEEYFKDVDNCTGEITNVCLKCKDILIFNEYDFPCIKAKSIEIGGNLPAGYYEIAIAYSTLNESASTEKGEEISDYLAYTTGVTIIDYNNLILDQTNLDYATNQSISIEVSNLDLDYDYYKVLVMYRSGNNPVIQYIPVGVYPTSQTEVIISTLPADSQRLTAYDYLNRRITYLTSDGMEEVGGYLFQHGLTQQKTINLQPIVSLMGGMVKWATGKSYERLYRNGTSSANFMTYYRNETYPLSIQFKMLGGHITDNFIFVARPPFANEIEEISKTDLNYLSVTADSQDCSEVNRDKVWQFLNTAQETEEFECNFKEGDRTETIEREYECLGYGIEIEEGVLYEDIEESIVEWINNNKEYILNSEDESLESIKEALLAEDSYDDCVPDAPDYCDSVEVISEEIIAVSVENENFGEVSIPLSEYPQVTAPQYCGLCEEQTEHCGFLVDGEIRNEDVESVISPIAVVYQKVNPTNISCSTATPTNNTVGTHLQDMSSTTGESSLLSGVSVSTTSVDFRNKLHNNAIFYKVDFTYQEEVVIQVSPLNCVQFDSNSNNKLRISVFSGCPVLTEVAGYGRIITDMTNISDINRTFILKKSDLPSGVTTAYIAFDSPIRSFVKVPFTITGTNGSAILTIDSQTATAVFNTDLNTTALNFYTTNKNLWDNMQIFSEVSDNVVTLTMTEEQYGNLTINNVSGDLNFGYSKGSTSYTLQPPCGCFTVQQKDVVYKTAIDYSNLIFAKKRVYKYSCEITVKDISDCDVVPDKKGTFSYVESTLKYPCNKELYDSSWLNISPSDLPEDYRNEFEQYYTNGIISGKYVLTNETNFMDKNIRHFKFPDNNISPFMEAFTNQDDSISYKSIINPIGFFIDNEVINAFLDIAVKNKLITKTEREKIVGYEIFRGDRRTNKSVIAKGLGFNMMGYDDSSRKENGNTKITYYPNYPLNDTSVQDNLNGIYSTYKTNGNIMYTFHSPNTHFEKPTLPQEVYIEGFQYGVSTNTFAPFLNHPKYSVLGKRAYNVSSTLAGLELAAETTSFIAQLTIDATGTSWQLSTVTAFILASQISLYGATTPYKFNQYRYDWINTFENLNTGHNHAYIGLAEGQYYGFRGNSFTNSKRRGNEIISYLDSGRRWMTKESTGQKYYINNFQREDSVFFKFGDNYTVSYFNNLLDNSRMNIPTKDKGILGEYSRSTFAPYLTLTQYRADQYGKVNSIQWIPTGYCGDLRVDNSCDIIFGGDIYISRFSVKRKFPFFTETAYKLGAKDPYKYSSYFNINTGNKVNRGWIDYKTSIDNFGTAVVTPLIKTSFSLYDGDWWVTEENNNMFYVPDDYKFLTYYFGIPYFLVESEINCWNRYGGIQDKDQYYPLVDNTIEWVQEDRVTIREKETFRYNEIYSSTPHKRISSLLPENYSKELWDKNNDLSNSVIYSQKDVDKGITRSPWLNYKANDFHKFPQEFGKLVDIRGIESEQILFRFTDGFLVLGAVDKLRDKLTETTDRLGTGGIFDERAINFSTSDLGHAGTQHKAIISTPFGHIWADTKRGKVYLLKPNGTELQELSLKMYEWFKEQLPFKILRRYPNVNIDQNYNGLGISLGYDDRTKRVLLTKLDYIPKSTDLKYDETVGFYTGELSCSEGYELINGVCTKTDVVNKEPVGDKLSLINAGSVAHGMQFPNLYSDYTSGGGGLIDVGSSTGYTFEKLTAPFWTGNGVVADRLTTKFGKWVSGGGLSNVWYGGSFLIKAPSSKVYHIVLAADNLFKLKVNGVTILTSNQTEIGQQNTSNPVNYDAQTFRQVHIYPIELTTGCHVITLEAMNQGGDAMFGACILDNTVQELRDATSYSDLNFIYSTENENYFYVNEEVEFTCPDGYEELSEGICGECQKVEIDPNKNFELIPFENEDYFEKAHFTIGYSFLTEDWVSFYSFYPNYYISHNDYFQTGVNTTDINVNGVWTHHPLINSYQVFYGKLYPFEIEYPVKTQLQTGIIDSVNFFLETRKYYNYYDSVNIFDKGFNKSYIYNNFQNSGLLNLIPQEYNNLRQTMTYPIYNSDSIDTIQTRVDGSLWSFNYLFNHIKNERSGIPPFIYDNVSVNKELNPLAIDYRKTMRDRLRGDYFLVRLIQDKYSQYKLLYRAGKTNRQYYV